MAREKDVKETGDRYSGVRETRPFTYNDCGGSSLALANDFKKRCFKMADRSSVRVCNASKLTVWAR